MGNLSIQHQWMCLQRTLIFLCVTSYLCHLMCVCLQVCVKGTGGLKGCGHSPSLLIGSPRFSCPQGHFLLFAHLLGNPPVTPWPSMSASRQMKGFPWKQWALLSFLPFSLSPAVLLLIQTLYPSLPCPEAITHTHMHAQTNDCKHSRKK